MILVIIIALVLIVSIVSIILHQTFGFYVINMDHETARYEKFLQHYEVAGLPGGSLQRFPAVQGSSIDVRRYMSESARREFEDIKKRGYRTEHHQLSEGAVGLWLSHLGVWRDILKSGRAGAMVFEDDAVFDRSLKDALDTKKIPEDADIVLFGQICEDCTPSTSPEWMKVRRFYQTHCYVITARGAEKALRHVGPLEKQIDSWLSDMAAGGHLTIYTSRGDGLVTQDTAFGSSIQTPIQTGL